MLTAHYIFHLYSYKHPVPSRLQRKEKKKNSFHKRLIMDQDVDVGVYLPSKPAIIFSLVFFSTLIVVYI